MTHRLLQLQLVVFAAINEFFISSFINLKKADSVKGFDVRNGLPLVGLSLLQASALAPNYNKNNSVESTLCDSASLASAPSSSVNVTENVKSSLQPSCHEGTFRHMYVGETTSSKISITPLCAWHFLVNSESQTPNPGSKLSSAPNGEVAKLAFFIAVSIVSVAITPF